MYVMTNGRREWLAELEGVLTAERVRVMVRVDAEPESKTPGDMLSSCHRTATARENNDAREDEEEDEEYAAVPLTWDAITTSRDLALTWEQKGVAQAVDMYIATRAGCLSGMGCVPFRLVNSTPRTFLHRLSTAPHSYLTN